MMGQTTDTKNIWKGIHQSSSRRIMSDGQYNFFWVCDEKGRYGLLIRLLQSLSDIEFDYKIKGITIILHSTHERGTDLYLIVNDNNDWEIFYSVCLDLLAVSEKSSSEIILINKLKSRIKRWQFFLTEQNSLSLSEVKQMGLLTELLCLKDRILPHLSNLDAIVSWVGPNFDRQDFSLAGFFIEVKSYISSKGAIVTISSLHQLINNIKPLYLIAYGLSKSENGVSIADVELDISEMLEANSESYDLFQQKLAQYGYMRGVTENPFYKFRIDNISYFAVTDDFPKILPSDVQGQITTVQYTIDLAKCVQFETDLSVVLN
jgi:hypothetical protein